MIITFSVLAAKLPWIRSIDLWDVFLDIWCWFRCLDKIFRFLKIFRKIITSLLCYFSIQNSLFKNVFGHNFCICQLIFKIFVAYFTTNLALNIFKKILCLSLNYPWNIILRSQKHLLVLLLLTMPILWSYFAESFFSLHSQFICT